MQVKHDYSEMNEGETVVLTLADKELLARKGLSVAENEDEEDELENVLKVWPARASCHGAPVGVFSAQCMRGGVGGVLAGMGTGERVT